MEIKDVSSAEFMPYGRVITDLDLSTLLSAMETLTAPTDGTVYVPSDAELENLPGMKAIIDSLFGCLPAQVGYCNGFNKKLNALEYHRSSEIDVAIDDLILLLGRQQDLIDGCRYDTANVEAFLVSAGTAVELYATTLHYAPCSVNDTCFRCVVMLPKDTNTDLEGTLGNCSEDRLITAKNKCLISHSWEVLEKRL